MREHWVQAYVGIAVNLKMFAHLLLSGFFMRRGSSVKGLLLVYVLPSALPALPAFIRSTGCSMASGVCSTNSSLHLRRRGAGLAG